MIYIRSLLKFYVDYTLASNIICNILYMYACLSIDRGQATTRLVEDTQSRVQYIASILSSP